MKLRSPHAQVEDRDPYKDRLIDPPVQCQHGNGTSCACQLPFYEGFFVAPLMVKLGPDMPPKTRHFIVRVQQAYDGMMREFRDPMTDDVVGCCSSDFWFANQIKSVEDFCQ